MYYKMDHERRGLALIFNHEFFEDDAINSRTGTNVDCENLASTLKSFGFEVRHFHDLTYQCISNYLGEVAKMDHSQHDCLVVVVLSHGDLGELYAHDRKYNAESIWSSFTSSNCPSLEGKPRLFFIQACRGDQTDEGIKLQYCRSEPDGHPNLVFRIPTHRDFLIAYSTIPGFYSWRNKKQGSWFVQALCSELDVYGDRQDLLTILTFVCQRVAIDFESYSPERANFHQKKQIPAVTTMLTRLVKFARV
ncbi:caspase-like isoform X3 [Nasonia vitripennis]|nr:caspase-like isoform X3 [Nasonia vitripennis]